MEIRTVTTMNLKQFIFMKKNLLFFIGKQSNILDGHEGKCNQKNIQEQRKIHC